jgi:hypothetical protein
MRPYARPSEVARRYGIAELILFRWKQEMKPRLRQCSSLWRSLTRLPIQYTATRSTHHDATSSGREGAPGLRL